jgi:hypothetical protein
MSGSMFSLSGLPHFKSMISGDAGHDEKFLLIFVQFDFFYQ